MKKSNIKKNNPKPTPSSLHGIQKWIKDYRDRFSMDLKQLEKTSRDYLSQNNNQSNNGPTINDRINNTADGDDNDDGWTVVSRSLKKTRQRMVPSTDKTLNRLRAKHKYSQKKKELVNFYKFQMNDKKIDQLEQLKMKFELDKQRIAQMRQQRKFKPF